MQSSSEPHGRYWVTFFILITWGILRFIVYFAGESHLDGNIPSDSVCQKLDANIFKYHINIYAYVLGAFTLFFACFFAKSNKIFFRDVVNTIFFAEVILFIGWITAHTGGFSKSLYGAGYLALFPVATIVPRDNWIKVVAGIVVALVAIIISCYAQEKGREFFICGCSILGCSLGWGILWTLSKTAPS